MAVNGTVGQVPTPLSPWQREMNRNDEALERTETLVKQLCERLDVCSVSQPPAGDQGKVEVEQGSRMTSEIINRSRRLERLNAVLEDQLARLQV